MWVLPDVFVSSRKLTALCFPRACVRLRPSFRRAHKNRLRSLNAVSPPCISCRCLRVPTADLIGDKTPAYLYNDVVPSLMKRFAPDTKIIVLVGQASSLQFWRCWSPAVGPRCSRSVALVHSWRRRLSAPHLLHHRDCFALLGNVSPKLRDPVSRALSHYLMYVTADDRSCMRQTLPSGDIIYEYGGWQYCVVWTDLGAIRHCRFLVATSSCRPPSSCVCTNTLFHLHNAMLMLILVVMSARGFTRVIHSFNAQARASRALSLKRCGPM